MRIAATPDHIGQAEDVVWEARGDDAFLSPRTWCSPSTRPATSCSRTIANCLYRRGRMVEEWVVRDSLAIALQLGQDPDEVAREKPAILGYSGSMTEAAADRRARRRRLRPPPRRLPPRGRRWCSSSSSRSGTAATSRPSSEYLVRDLTLHTVGYHTVIRPEGYRRALLQMLRPFPRRALRGPRRRRPTTPSATPASASPSPGSTRASTTAPPTSARSPGRPVEILGVSQFLVQDGRIVREVRVYDEIAVRSPDPRPSRRQRVRRHQHLLTPGACSAAPDVSRSAERNHP